LLLEQAELRRRATAKFSRAALMYFTRVGLEQATDQWVAAYKAARFNGTRTGPSVALRTVVDLCCGIGGDLIALSLGCTTTGVDVNPVAAHYAALNSGAIVTCTDVAEFDLNGVTAFHIDPDRRPAGQRTTSLAASQPDLATIERLITRVPNAAVKLAPATRVSVDWSNRCELEWISRERECRQLVAWHGELAQSPGRRRATIVATAEHAAARTIIGAPDQPVPIVRDVDEYVFDVDAAVSAAHLNGVLAAEHLLSGLSNGPSYLTGPRALDDPALACFAVVDVLPFELRNVAGYLAERSIGRLEIKKRGVDIEPDALRRDLKLRGDDESTLLVTRIAGRMMAIVARRV
jgi:hypothetical protein